MTDTDHAEGIRAAAQILAQLAEAACAAALTVEVDVKPQAWSDRDHGPSHGHRWHAKVFVSREIYL